jgi:hypothetical protein
VRPNQAAIVLDVGRDNLSERMCSIVVLTNKVS